MKVKGKRGVFEKSRMPLLMDALDNTVSGGTVERAHEKIGALAAIIINMLARNGTSDEEFLGLIESNYEVAGK